VTEAQAQAIAEAALANGGEARTGVRVS
jgi:hypothetical protein